MEGFEQGAGEGLAIPGGRIAAKYEQASSLDFMQDDGQVFAGFGVFRFEDLTRTAIGQA